ncbi:catalase-related domain-containing protein, partial [Colwellia sp. TT2012]|uniref:catalase-related domain-containing protein n=1 Tax=Colwellia sp. TT2012 TaxID=1720342 RepID=UPI000AA9AA5A
PNSQGEWAEQPGFSEPPLDLQGYAAHWDHRADEDYFSQAGDLFRLMTVEQQHALFNNTASAMSGVPDEIKQRHIKHCTAADAAYGAGLKTALNL